MKPKENIDSVGTVLLIENDPTAMEKSQNLLQVMGYNVLVSKTGEQALGIANTYGKDINLAILDVNAQDRDLLSTFSSLAKARPSMKIIVSSQYDIDFWAKEILEAGAHGLIQKPFTSTALSEKLKQITNANYTSCHNCVPK